MNDTITKLAADIREVDGNNDIGASALAEALVAKGWLHQSEVVPTVPIEAVVTPLHKYQQGDYVEVLKDGAWLPGKIAFLTRSQNTASVDTERGPVTVYLTGQRIRTPQLPQDDA